MSSLISQLETRTPNSSSTKLIIAVTYLASSAAFSKASSAFAVFAEPRGASTAFAPFEAVPLLENRSSSANTKSGRQSDEFCCTKVRTRDRMTDSETPGVNSVSCINMFDSWRCLDEEEGPGASLAPSSSSVPHGPAMPPNTCSSNEIRGWEEHNPAVSPTLSCGTSATSMMPSSAC